MKKILKLNEISPLANTVFGNKYCLTEDRNSPVAIMLRSFDMHGFDLPESVCAVARAGAGTNNIPIAELTEKGVTVFNTPGANANAVKELCLAALFMSSRGIIDGIEWTKTLSGEDIAKQAEKGKKQFAGREILGKTLGVIGLGAIGVQVGNNAVRLGMNVLGYDPYITIDSAWKLNHNITKTDSLDEIFALSDYITLHVPLTDGTRGMIDKSAVSKMKHGVNIINLSRGELCVNADIISAVNSGKIHSYITDFASPELLNIKGITVMPHLGASTEEAEDNCAVFAAQQLVDFLDNGNIKNSVNFPDCSAPRAPDTRRMTVIHRNVKNVLNNITDIVSAAEINIENLVSRSRGEYAYTIIDTDGKLDGNVIDAVSKSINVIKTRLI